jgi:predicted XRE-type DNA-binding protein
MVSEQKFESIWDTLVDDADDANDLKKRSDYLILIWARLNGQSGREADKAEQTGLPVDQIHDLVNGRINQFNLPQLIEIARKIGVTVRL